MTSPNDIDDALERVMTAGVRERFSELGAALRQGTPEPFFVSALLTEPLPMHRAIVAWQALDRVAATTGLAPVLIEPDAFETLLALDAPTFAAWQSELARRSAEDRSQMKPSDELLDPARIESLVRERLQSLDAALEGRLEQDLAKLSPEALSAWEVGEDLAVEELYEASDDDDDDDEEATDSVEPGSDRARSEGGSLMLAKSPYAAGVDESSVLRAYANRGRAQLAVFAAQPWEVLALLGFGAFNACPGPEAHAVRWRSFYERFGARPFLVGQATIDGLVARPPATLDELARCAAEHLAYAPEAASEGLLPYAWSLFRCGGWGFWWD